MLSNLKSKVNNTMSHISLISERKSIRPRSELKDTSLVNSTFSFDLNHSRSFLNSKL